MPEGIIKVDGYQVLNLSEEVVASEFLALFLVVIEVDGYRILSLF